MIPLQLSLTGFLSYRDPVEIDFSRTHLACISGSNGAGKSSLLDAITWALFGRARKQDDALIHNLAAYAQVELIFAYEGNIYRVLRRKPRGKPTLLEFHILQNPEADQPQRLPAQPIWKALTEHSLRETERRITEMLRMDYDTFINASFFLQGKADQFAQQRPGDRKRILSSILGLEIWESYRERAANRRRQVETELAQTDILLQEIEQELAEEEPRKRRLAELQAELKHWEELRKSQEKSLQSLRQTAAVLAHQKELVDQLGRQVQSTRSRLEQLQSRLEERRGKQAEYLSSLAQAEAIQAAFQSWQEAQRKLAEWEAIADRFREQEKRREAPRLAIQEARARLEQERDLLRSQAERLEQERREAMQVQVELQTLQQELQRLEEQLHQRPELEARLQQSRQQQTQALSENQVLKPRMDELKKRLDQLKSLQSAECPLCGQPLGLEDRQRLIETLQAEGTQMGNTYRANRALVESCAAQIGALEQELTRLNQMEGEQRRLAQQAAQLEERGIQWERRQSEWQQVGARRLAEIERLLAEGAYAPEAQAELARIDAELRAIGYDPEAHETVRQQELQLRPAQEARRGLELASAALTPLQEEIGALERQEGEVQAELLRQEQEYSRALADYQAAEAQLPDLEYAEGLLMDTREQENRLRQEVGSANQEVQVLETLKKRRTALREQRSEQATQIGYYKQLERAFSKDGVPAQLIEQALPEIETRANYLLDRLSAGDMSVHFETLTVYKDKGRDDLKETLDIQIRDSAGLREYELFSGGEAFRINFAIRLALSGVLAQRAGARLQTLVIDEGFGSQDAQGRQRLIEALHLIQSDFALILVITHVDELKEAFPTRLEVEKTERGSMVRIID